MKELLLLLFAFTLALSAYPQDPNSELERMKKQLDDISSKINGKQKTTPKTQQPAKKSAPKRTATPAQAQNRNSELERMKHTLDSISAMMNASSSEKKLKAKTLPSTTKPVPKQRIITTEEPETVPSAKNDLRLTIGGGYAYRLGKAPKTGTWVDRFEDNARGGLHIEVEAQKYLWGDLGLGLNIYYVYGNHSAKNVATGINYAEETNTFLYFGPSFAARFGSDRWKGYASYGLGLVFFNNSNSTVGSQHSDGSAGKVGFGMDTSISGEYRVNPKLGVGLKLSVTNATTDGADFDMDERLSLSNFLIGGFISFGN
jgi:hypothetical protein